MIYAVYLLSVLLVISVLQSGCRQHLDANAIPPEPISAPQSVYQFKPEDVVEIMVWKNPDLSREVIVRPDGKISLPLIGDVQAAGVTAEELAAAITQKLVVYYKDPPEVSVIVKQFKNPTIYILGNVNTQGKFEVRNGTTFLQAISLAEGFNEFASRNKLILRRKLPNGEELTIRLRYKDIVSGREENLMLQHGDTIIVP
jgi:polysaccharide export outer membrane protein